MDAVYSGQTGTMALIRGADVEVIRAGSPDDTLTICPEGVSYLFPTSRDLVVTSAAKLDEVKNKFRIACDADRALRLLLIALDVEEPTEIREEATECANELLRSTGVVTFVENQFYSKPLPSESDVSVLVTGQPNSPALALISRVVTRQVEIARHRHAWDQLPHTLFLKENKAEFEERAIEQGAFRILASVDPKIDDPNIAIFNVLQVLRTLPNSRTIVTEWTKDFKRKASHPINMPEEAEDEPEERDASVSSHVSYTSALQQKDAIIRLVQAGKIGLARKYTDQLVESQLEDGGKEYAVKSLCSLAQVAKYFGLHSLQLEWAQRATHVNPSDAWAHGQAADALMEYYRLDEALEELRLCEAYGDAQFAVTGRARVLRLQGRLDEALTAFKRAYEEFPSHEGAPFALAGRAETLRDMWRFEEALAEYEAAIKRFPDYVPFLCGKASVLAEMGRLEDALLAYEIPHLRTDLVALNGRSSVLKQLGRFEEALATLRELIVVYPTDPVARCSQADTLRLLGRYEEALQVYSYTKRTYPNISVPYSGYAETLRDKGQFNEAIREYEEAFERFPFDCHILNGYANIMKVSDNLHELLRLYDQSVHQFPYNLVSKFGRADLLKRIGKYEEALDAYNEIIVRWPDYLAARHGKAAILVLRGRFDEAERLLPGGLPSTRDEWIAWHIRGMILLRKNLVDDAIRHFKRALEQTPFARERRYFARGLCAAQLRKEQFGDAFGVLENLRGGLSNILRMHALGGIGNVVLARATFRELSFDCPPQLTELKDAVAGRFGIIAEIKHHHNDNWIFERETEALLQEAA